MISSCNFFHTFSAFLRWFLLCVSQALIQRCFCVGLHWEDTYMLVSSTLACQISILTVATPCWWPGNNSLTGIVTCTGWNSTAFWRIAARCTLSRLAPLTKTRKESKGWPEFSNEKYCTMTMTSGRLCYVMLVLDTRKRLQILHFSTLCKAVNFIHANSTVRQGINAPRVFCVSRFKFHFNN